MPIVYIHNTIKLSSDVCIQNKKITYVLFIVYNSTYMLFLYFVILFSASLVHFVCFVLILIYLLCFQYSLFACFHYS